MKNDEIKIVSNNDVATLKNVSNVFDQIAFRSSTANHPIEFHSIDENALQKISESMGEINRATRVLGRPNTQVTNKLMTLTMLNDTSPYRVLRQCITQIEDRRKAIQDNLNRMRKSNITINRFKEELEYLKEELNSLTVKATSFNDKMQLVKIRSEIQLKETAIDFKSAMISDNMIYIEGALKEIASFQEAYNQILKNHNIPENWDELDVENQEVWFHIRFKR